MTHVDNLTRAERIQAMKQGMKLAMAYRGITDEMLVKHADAFDPISPALKLVIGVSLLAGVPLGIAAHMVGRQVSADRAGEKGQLDRIRYYNRLSSELAGGIQGAQNVP